jgi:hypothetical protein
LKASKTFILILALVSIISLIGIVSDTLFDFDIAVYIEALWMTTIGIGFIIEGQITKLKNIKYQGLTPTNFTHLTTVIIGVIAVITGIFSIPAIRIEAHGFLAVTGIISLVSIVIIIIQTWVVE